MQEKKNNPRNTAVLLDILHIVVGIMVVICAVLAFLSPDQNQILFPVIFSLAALLNGVNGWVRLKDGGRDKKKRSSGIVLAVVASLLLVLAIVSAISIWR